MRKIISGGLRFYLAAICVVALYDILYSFSFIQSLHYHEYPEKFQDFERSELISTIVTAIIMVNIIIYLSVNAVRDFRGKSVVLWPMFVISFIAVFFAVGLRFLFGFQFAAMSIYELIFTVFSLIATFYFMIHDYVVLFWIKRKKITSNH